jgi:hypothetical protein
MDQRGPEYSNPHENKPKEPMDFLYKGMHVGQFGDYFTKGGIFPTDPRPAWITQNWHDAESYASMYASEMGLFGNTLRDPFCLAVIDKSVLKHGNLHVHSSVNDLVTDYNGNEIIEWDEVPRLLCHEDAIPYIKAAFDKVQPSGITWDDFQNKIIRMDYDPAEAIVKGRGIEAQIKSALAGL